VIQVVPAAGHSVVRSLEQDCRRLEQTFLKTNISCRIGRVWDAATLHNIIPCDFSRCVAENGAGVRVLKADDIDGSEKDCAQLLEIDGSQTQHLTAALGFWTASDLAPA